jgi:quinoprotein glucose dehydrogenase
MPPGYVNAFDVRTGKHLWTFHTVPKAGEFGYDSWLNGSAEFNGNTNVWGGMAYDPELDYVYMAVSTPTSDYYGVDRHGDNLFAESLVCVEAKTGKRVWHFQAVHHGLWDYDFPTNPILGDITVNGRRIRAVIQVSKQAFTYVFDRKTGQPVWPIEERPVPQSTVAGERTSPTQPIPSKPPAFDLQGSLEANLIDFTPELRQRGLEQLKTFVAGPLYMPPSEQGTLQLPGNLGGANWGGAAFDPETGILYVPSRTTPTIARATPRAPGAAPGATPASPPASGAERGGQAGRGSAPQAAPAGRGLGASDHDDAQTGRGGTPGQGNAPPGGRGGGPGAGAANPANRMTVDGLPLFKPPYARLTAIDLNKGDHLWTTAVGEGPRNHPLLKDLKLPPLGDAMDGIGVLLTKNVVFVTTWRRQRGTGAALVPSWEPYGDPNALRKVLYAFDKRTGALLREFEMDGYSAAPPMSYMHGGKQYLVMAVGANEEAAMVAFGLPGARRR